MKLTMSTLPKTLESLGHDPQKTAREFVSQVVDRLDDLTPLRRSEAMLGGFERAIDEGSINISSDAATYAIEFSKIIREGIAHDDCFEPDTNRWWK